MFDDGTVAIPGLSGNNRLDSIENLVGNPGIALLFLIPGVDEMLRVKGTARLSTDPAVLDACVVNGARPKVAILVERCRAGRCGSPRRGPTRATCRRPPACSATSWRGRSTSRASSTPSRTATGRLPAVIGAIDAMALIPDGARRRGEPRGGYRARPLTVRDATEDDIRLVADITARGFAADPVMQWVFRDASTRADGLRITFTGLTRGYFAPHSAVQVVDDACAALWRAPAYEAPPSDGDDGPGPWTPDVAERLRILSELMEIAHPHDRPHWYLNVLATVPERQGQGLGAVALAAMLERIDAAGEPAYLESSNPRNMTLYRRHGFDDFADPIDLPDGPSLYPMWRTPPREVEPVLA